MALFFAENLDNKGGLQKIRLDEETLKDEEVQEAIDEKVLMSSSDMLAGSKGTIPKETETVDEKEVIKNYIKVQENINQKNSVQFLKTHSFLFNSSK